jgi:excisionase family DNA binding protein
MAWQSTLDVRPAQSLDDKFLNFQEACNLVNLSKPTIYKALANNTFPKPVLIAGCKRWSKQLLIRWLHDKQVAANNNK